MMHPVYSKQIVDVFAMLAGAFINVEVVSVMMGTAILAVPISNSIDIYPLA